jgi:hypothetical protein
MAQIVVHPKRKHHARLLRDGAHKFHAAPNTGSQINWSKMRIASAVDAQDIVDCPGEQANARAKMRNPGFAFPGSSAINPANNSMLANGFLISWASVVDTSASAMALRAASRSCSACLLAVISRRIQMLFSVVLAVAMLLSLRTHRKASGCRSPASACRQQEDAELIVETVFRACHERFEVDPAERRRGHAASAPVRPTRAACALPD